MAQRRRGVVAERLHLVTQPGQVGRDRRRAAARRAPERRAHEGEEADHEGGDADHGSGQEHEGGERGVRHGAVSLRRRRRPGLRLAEAPPEPGEPLLGVLELGVRRARPDVGRDLPSWRS